MSEAPWRRDTLGASDAPAILGVDPFRTAGDVWAEKTGRVTAEATTAADALDPKTLGKALGPALMEIAAARLGRPLAPEVFYQHPEAPLSCTVDGLALEGLPVLVEGKTVGLLGRSPLLDAYGDDGTDEVPESVLVQVHHSFGVLDAQPNLPRIDRAFVIALLGGRGLHTYEITRDDQLVRDVLHTVWEFWQNYVTTDRCPPDAPPSLPTLKRMPRRRDAPARVIDSTLVGEWQQAKAILKQATANEETCRRFILNELGDGEVGQCDLGRVTYFETARAAYMVQAGRVRTLRFTPTRERKVA